MSSKRNNGRGGGGGKERGPPQNNNLPTQWGRDQKSLAGGQKRHEKDGNPHVLIELCLVVS